MAPYRGETNTPVRSTLFPSFPGCLSCPFSLLSLASSLSHFFQSPLTPAFWSHSGESSCPQTLVSVSLYAPGETCGHQGSPEKQNQLVGQGSQRDERRNKEVAHRSGSFKLPTCHLHAGDLGAANIQENQQGSYPRAETSHAQSSRAASSAFHLLFASCFRP